MPTARATLETDMEILMDRLDVKNWETKKHSFKEFLFVRVIISKQSR